MKGLTMPINLIVVIAIAILVLVVLAAWFTGALFSGTAGIGVEEAFNRGCGVLLSAYKCDVNSVLTVTVPNYKRTSDDTLTHTLADICIDKGIPAGDNAACARACGCVVSGS